MTMSKSKKLLTKKVIAAALALAAAIAVSIGAPEYVTTIIDAITQVVTAPEAATAVAQ